MAQATQKNDFKPPQAALAHYERSSPTLLSQQPSVVKDKNSNAATAEWNILRSHLEQRLVSLRNWRQSWWTQNWSDIAEFILPRRSIWLTQSAGGMPTPNSMTRGRQINQSIVDPTATFALRVCAGGLMSGLASPSRPWFKISPSIKTIPLDAAARLWMDTTEDRVYKVLASSNFYNSFAQECEDLIGFGTAPTIIYEDEEDMIRLYNPVIGEYYLSSSASLRVNGLYRQFVMTIEQIVDFFGVENCPPEVQKLWEQKGTALQQERIIAHSIEPNYGIGNTDAGKVKGNFSWREVYWVYGGASASPLSMRGFADQPFTGARWATQSNDAYGRSPGMDVLPDVIQLQVETARKAEAIEKQVRPPLIASMNLKNQPSSQLPGHVTFVDSVSAGSGMRPIYEVQPEIREMMEDIAQIQARIKTGFFNDLFLLLEQMPNAKMTAYEVAQRMQEKLQVLGPVIEGLLTESLKPKLKRIYGILQRRGMIDPLPDSLKNVPLDIEFVSILALAQKASATGGLERMVALAGNMVQIFPNIKDVLNSDNLYRAMNDMLGNPQIILNAPEQVAAARQAEAQQAQQAQQMAAMQHAAKTADIGANAAQTMSQTQIGGGADALSQLLGTGGGH